MLMQCPICLWTGRDWCPVESRPRVFARKGCPRCGSYPRDRITFILLERLQQSSPKKKLAVGEIGGSVHSYTWKKKRYDYWNADIAKGVGKKVDVAIKACRIQSSPTEADVAILSYVLSEVERKQCRIGLMKELHRFTTSAGRMIFFDDLALTSRAHRIHSEGAFFHTIQLGRPILGEMKSADWRVAVIDSFKFRGIKAEMEMPFILAAKSQHLLLGLLRCIRTTDKNQKFTRGS
jgi:hypothetical protein